MASSNMHRYVVRSAPRYTDKIASLRSKPLHARHPHPTLHPARIQPHRAWFSSLLHKAHLEHRRRQCSNTKNRFLSSTDDKKEGDEFEYQDPTLSWASNNRILAERCLVQPPLKTTEMETKVVTPNFLNNNNKKYEKDTKTASKHIYPSLESYCAARQWVFPVSSSDEEQKALGLVSHILSAPLTLAHFHTMEQQQQQKTSSSSSATTTTTTPNQQSFRWCCIGARAEATLPINFWQEFLFMATTATTTNTPIHVQLDFVGPDILIPSRKGPNIQSLSWNGSTMDLKWRYKGFFHTMMMEEEKNDENNNHNNNNNNSTTDEDNYQEPYYDAYVLYNPGLGHQNQIENWKPTIEYLLQLQEQHQPPKFHHPNGEEGQGYEEEWQQQKQQPRRRRPTIWLTAHSQLDAQRDAQILQEYYKVEHVTYERNPFTSRVTYQDPLLLTTKLMDDDDDDDDSVDLSLVRPNEYVAMIP